MAPNITSPSLMGTLLQARAAARRRSEAAR